MLFGWLVLNAVFLVSLLVHELAHALAMVSIKVKIHEFLIGVPWIFKIQIKNLPEIGIGPIFLAGGVVPDDELENRPLWQQSYVIAAGPIATLLFAVCMLWLGVRLSPDLNAERWTASFISFSKCDLPGISSLAYSVEQVYQETGIAGILVFTGVINLVLAVFNLLPIPPLDGGRLFFLVLEYFFGQKIKKLVTVLTYAIGGILIAQTLWVIVSEAWGIGSRVITAAPPC